MSGEDRNQFTGSMGVSEVSRVKRMRAVILLDLKDNLHRSRELFDNGIWFSYDKPAEQLICHDDQPKYGVAPSCAFVTMTMAVKLLDVRDRHFRIRNSIPLADNEYYKLVVDSINEIIAHPHR